MEELRQFLGLLIMMFAITLKATVRNMNAISTRVSSVATRSLLQLDALNPFSLDLSSVFNIPIAANPATLHSVAHPKCVPADFNHTMPAYYEWLNHHEVCSMPQSEILAGDYRQHQHGIAHSQYHPQKFARKILVNTRLWRVLAGRLLQQLRDWAVGFVICLGCINDPDILHAFEQLRLVLKRRGKNVSNDALVIHSRDDDPLKIQVLPFQRHALFRLGLLWDDRMVLYSWPELPLVIHSFVGYGVFNSNLHEVTVHYRPSRHVGRQRQIHFVGIDQTYVEGRLLHCVYPARQDYQDREPLVNWVKVYHRTRISRSREGWKISSFTKSTVLFQRRL